MGNTAPRAKWIFKRNHFDLMENEFVLYGSPSQRKDICPYERFSLKPAHRLVPSCFMVHQRERFVFGDGGTDPSADGYQRVAESKGFSSYTGRPKLRQGFVWNTCRKKSALSCQGTTITSGFLVLTSQYMPVQTEGPNAPTSVLKSDSYVMKCVWISIRWELIHSSPVSVC